MQKLLHQAFAVWNSYRPFDARLEMAQADNNTTPELDAICRKAMAPSCL
jgi:hypothetical protein